MKYPRRTCIDKAYPKDDPSADLQLFSRGGFYSTKEKEKDAFTCPLCRTERKPYFFPWGPDLTLGFGELPKDAATEFRRGMKHSIFCLPCLNKLAAHLEEEFDGDKLKVVYRICSLLNVAFDAETARKVIVDDNRILLPENANFFEEPMDPRVTYIDAYLRYVKDDERLSRMTFWGEQLKPRL